MVGGRVHEWLTDQGVACDQKHGGTELKPRGRGLVALLGTRIARRTIPLARPVDLRDPRRNAIRVFVYFH